jgi:hypothetical protein
MSEHYTDTRVHYLETGREIDYRLKTGPGCHRDHALCGNGAPPSHLYTTRNRKAVTCEACLAKLEK